MKRPVTSRSDLKSQVSARSAVHAAESMVRFDAESISRAID